MTSSDLPRPILRCLRCGREHAFDSRAYLCVSCGAPSGEDPGVLDVIYDYDAARDRWPCPGDGGRRDVFRWAPLLPVAPPRRPVLPAGGTPLVPAPRLARRLGLRELYLKDETRNPTRALKDRATAVAVAMALADGADTMYCASAGNAGISLAGFCAHAGLGCHVWVPARASEVRLGWLRRFGAEIHVSGGDYDAAFDESEAEGARSGWRSRNCAYNPFLVEGKKTVSFEIAEQLGRAPDLLVAPVGDGCTLAAAGKAFRELRRMARVAEVPRLVGAQAEPLQPLVRRFHGQASIGDEGERESRAVSIAVRRPRNALRLLAELEASGGTMLAVPDHETERAAHLLASEAGLVAEFTSAAALAALIRLAKSEPLADRTAVLIVTGGRAE